MGRPRRPYPVIINGENFRKRSPRAEIAEFVGQYLEHHSSFTLRQVTLLAVGRFQDDPEFIQRFMEEQFEPMVRDIVATRVRQTRGLISLGDSFVTREEWMAYVKAQAPRFDVWREWTSQGHVRLLDMTVSQLDDAIAIRQRRVANEIGVINFLIDLRNGVVHAGADTVKEVFTSEEIATARARWASLEVPDDADETPNGDAASAN